MALTAPRIPPVSLEDYARIYEEAVGEPLPSDREVLTVQRTIAQNPALVKARYPLVRHLVHESTLPPREKEMAILRVGWLCQAEYEFAQHWERARKAGLADSEVRRLTEGPDAEGWTGFESALLRAVDELLEDKFISDETWAALNERYSTNQVMDLVFLVGSYTGTCMALKSFGVQLEAGKPRFADLERVH